MWDDRLQQLLDFRRTYGHVDVPRRWTDNPPLAHWVMNQRREIRHGRMTADRLRRLEEEGIRWSGARDLRERRDREWDRRFEALAAFQRAHGHGNVPSSWAADPGLGRWVARQRHQYRVGSIREDRRRRLDQLGVDWPAEPGRSRSRDLGWDRMVAALAAFREIHQHSNVPKGWPEHPQLARWVARQRRLNRCGALRPDRRQRLEELGALHDAAPARRANAPEPAEADRAAGTREQAWTRMCGILAAFKSVQGHCDVPRRWAWNPALARWVSEQRRLRRKGKLSPERAGRLEDLGFEWVGTRALRAARASSWEVLYRRLLDYRNRHGNCDVPARFPDDPALGRWIAAQRTLRRSGVLQSDRQRLLDSIGFSWTVRAILRAR
jgi:hypothetical protein